MDELTPAERAEIDRVRDVLSDPVVWVEPSDALQEQIVSAIAAETRPRPRYRLALLAAAAAVLVGGVATGVALTRDDHPVEFAADLVGTSLAPDAQGDVTLTRTTSGWKITLHATGLPRRADGEYYEAWLKSSDGELVPVGTFNEGKEVVLWAGVSPAEFPTFTVTQQEANGDPASTGRVVLGGTTRREP